MPETPGKAVVVCFDRFRPDMLCHALIGSVSGVRPSVS